MADWVALTCPVAMTPGALPDDATWVDVSGGVSALTRPADTVVAQSCRAPQLAVVLPCHNEAASIASVIRTFSKALPEAQIYVCDNASTDATALLASEAGAIVIKENRRGKGHAVRRLFADVDADVYVLADGDGTYDAASAPDLVQMLLADQLDMVIGARRVAATDGTAYRRGHATGNALLTSAFRICLGGQFTDLLSGYRVMSRRFVKSFPSHAQGFDIEAELTAHAVEVYANCLEVSTAYKSREEGSVSKLRTVRDGLRISSTVLRLFEAMYPLRFFAIAFVVLTAIALVLGIPVINEYRATGLVLRFPTAILAASIQIVAFLSLTCGVVLKSVKLARQEGRRLAYLAYGAPGAVAPPDPHRSKLPETSEYTSPHPWATGHAASAPNSRTTSPNEPVSAPG